MGKSDGGIGSKDEDFLALGFSVCDVEVVERGLDLAHVRMEVISLYKEDRGYLKGGMALANCMALA